MIQKTDSYTIPDPLEEEYGPLPCGPVRVARYEGGNGKPRTPNYWIPDSDNGNDQPRLTWFAQWRFINEVRENRDFAFDLWNALQKWGLTDDRR